MSVFDEAPHVEPRSRDEWRAWLEENHAKATSVWLVMGRPAAGPVAVDYEAAVEEALCFGWVDSRGGKVDERRTKLYFAPRKARSPWTASNKDRVERLTAAGKMAPAGTAAVEAAKASGAWTLLDGAGRLEVPDDLAEALAASPPARRNWDAFPPSLRRTVLEQIALARKPETRARRIAEAAEKAYHNERPGR